MAEAAPQTITTEDYLRRVWPVAGHFALFSNGQHTWVDGPAAAASKAAQASAFGHDVYYSISAFGKQNRAARFAVSNHTFQLDLDTGDHATKYATQEEALRAATDWVAQHNFFVPTFIVNSGWGYHLVWVLTEPVATDRWLAVAQQFKRALQATGLKFDPAVPADAARIMRVPGTNNHKDPDHPQPCFVLHDSGRTVTLEDFARALPVTGPRDALPAPAPGKPKVENEYTKGLDADFPPSRIDPIVSKCQQMAQAVRDEGKTTEPLWRARLSILWRCEGGEALIHAFSQGDPRYDAAQTLAKAQNTAGPATCAHFNDLDPAHCQGCPFLGKITSPILLGTDLPEPPVLPGEEEQAPRVNQFGNWRVTGVGVRLVVKDEDTGTEDLVPVTRCPLWVTEVRERARDPDENDTSSLQINWHAVDGRAKHAVIMQSEVHENKSLTKWLADQNLISQIDNVKLLAAYIKEATYEITKLGRTTTYYDRLGWFGNSFVMAGHKITADAVTPVRVQSSTPIGVLSLAKGGSAQTWGTAVAALADHPASHWHLFTILAGFASPLLKLAGWQSAILSLAGATGTGKSTAMWGALSIYGEPHQMMMTATATANAVGLQMAAHQNLPLGLDEISRWPAWRFCDFGYDSTNGEGKASLTQQRSMRRAPRWSLLPIVTTNNPIYDMSTSDIDEPIRRRVLELQFSRMETLPVETAEALHLVMDANFGHPGVAYMQHVIKLGPKVREMLLAADHVLKDHSGLAGSDRFQRWLLAAVIVGASLACGAGIFPVGFNPQHIIQKVVDYAAQASKGHAPEEIKVKDAIADFLIENKANVIYWASAGPDYLPGQMTAFVEQDVYEPVARYDFHTDLLYVHATPLRKALREKHLSMSNVREWRRNHGIEEKVFKITRRLPAVNCFVFPAARIGLVMDEVVEPKGE
jgi:hypothetical protein